MFGPASSIFYEIDDRMKCYVIHVADCFARKRYVDALKEKAGAIVFDAIVDKEDGNNGCNQSHFAVYRSCPEEEDLLVFEDDCEILHNDFLEPLQYKAKYDVVFLGVNALGKEGSYGTHALWISPRGRAKFLEWIGKRKAPFPPIDHLWNEVIREYGLRVWRSVPVDKYVRQAKFVKSMITGQIR